MDFCIIDKFINEDDLDSGHLSVYIVEVRTQCALAETENGTKTKMTTAKLPATLSNSKCEILLRENEMNGKIKKTKR